MSKLNIDFAFEGFRIIRERPWLIPVWGVVLLIFSFASTAALIQFAGPALAELEAMSANPSSDPAQAMAVFGPIGQIYAVAMPLGLLVQAVIACAVYRSVLQPSASSFGFLRLGTAELLQIGLYIVLALMFLAAFLASLLAGVVVGGILSVVLGLIALPLAFIGVVVGVVLAYGGVIWIMIRFSLAGVQSFAEKKFNPFGSWELTKGNSWTLFGGYLIMSIMVLLVCGLCVTIYAIVVVALSGGNFSALSPIFDGGLTSWEAFTDPLMLSYLVVMNLLVSPLAVALMTGGPAGAYKQLAGTTKAKAESVF
ncbi:putative membrane protein [Asticcacaulis biprosthecium C19]|uniref:Putative membrane protein n=1 Tax=Asticcacaulis biprosthecium C19 TaxID=715226 RepID=F4QQ39_9CAUL|nr:hypothetical protein [Asticcacaulis biprosthecium]EGF90326.1 putative membrane protein [Asticcacaulis biprosthecium C19]